MEDIKKYALPVTVCLGFIILTFVVSLFFKRSEEEFIFEDDSLLKDYKINELIPTYVTEEQVAQKYLNEFVTLIINEPKKAYYLLDSSYRDSRFSTYESFEFFIKDRYLNDFNFYKASLSRYGSKVSNNKKYIYVYDKAGNKFLFMESSLMDYTVEIL